MEFAVYRVFHADGRKMGAFVDMYPSRSEAEDRARTLGGEHEVVGLWTREITEDEDYDTVVFEGDGVRPLREAV